MKPRSTLPTFGGFNLCCTIVSFVFYSLDTVLKNHFFPGHWRDQGLDQGLCPPRGPGEYISRPSLDDLFVPAISERVTRPARHGPQQVGSSRPVTGTTPPAAPSRTTLILIPNASALGASSSPSRALPHLPHATPFPPPPQTRGDAAMWRNRVDIARSTSSGLSAGHQTRCAARASASATPFWDHRRVRRGIVGECRDQFEDLLVCEC
jgi:hypothetical protein